MIYDGLWALNRWMLTIDTGVHDGRIDSPLLSTQQWDHALCQSSFSQLEISAKDFDSPANKMTLMLARALPEKSVSTLSSVEVLVDPKVERYNSPLAGDICSGVERGGFESRVVPWPLVDVCETKIYVVVDSSNLSVLAESSNERFAQIQKLVTKATRILWVLVNTSGNLDPDSRGGLVTGFARGARSENERLQLVTFDLGDVIVPPSMRKDSEVIEAILKVFLVSFVQSNGNGPLETEYAYRHNQIAVPRLIPRIKVNELVLGTRHSQEAVPSTTFNAGDRSLRLHVSKPGLLDSLIFVDDEIASRNIEDDEVEIEAKAFGINFRDVFIALGQMKPTVPMGGECSGLVTAVGSGCQSRFRPGDRVCAWYSTPYANRARAKWTNVACIPDSMSFTTAASVPVIFLTAYYGLVEVARLEKDQTVLIHSAAGGVGQAAIMIAQHLEANIFATVGNAAKRQLLIEKYDIPESQIFSSKPTAFKKKILQATGSAGMDVILSSVSGEALLETWDCIARFGTFVEIGKSDIYRNTHIGMRPFERNVAFASVDLVQLADYRSEKMQILFARIISMFEKKEMVPVHPVTVMSIAQIEDAFRLIQARKHTGKVVLEADECAIVKALPPRAKSLSLSASASYVVAGGLGGLGRKIIQFLASHGAKHILVLSRRTVPEADRRNIEQELTSPGSKVYFEACDITSLQMLEEVSMRAQQIMPPVKGIIQAAMVLQVRFEIFDRKSMG